MRVRLIRSARFALRLLIASGCGRDALPRFAAQANVQATKPRAVRTDVARGSVAVGLGAEPGPGVARWPVLHAPRAKHRLVPSREFDVELWGAASNTHTLSDDRGRGVVPVSEARFLRSDDALYVRLYAADLDLQIHNHKHDAPIWDDDSFMLAFFPPDGSQRRIAVSAVGTVADAICPRDAAEFVDPRCDRRWQSHARVAADCEGTLNRIDDRDEEWNVELAIPLRALGVSKAHGTQLSFALSRCEIAFDGPRACGRWGTLEMPATLVLD